MRLQAFHCPSCAARLDIKPGAGRVKCDYCGGALLVEDNAVTSSGRTRPAAKEADEPPYPEPPATLFSREAARFEMSVIEQKVPEAARDVFTHFELAEERFALVYLRAVDEKGHPVEQDLTNAKADVKESLGNDGDPGLAVNVALEGLSKRGFPHRLEAAILLFEPRHMTMTPYDAGCRDAIWWVSNEEGRCVMPGTAHEVLQKKFLRESRDYFSNGRTIHLAAGDLFVFVSAGFAGRGGKGHWPHGSGVLTEVLNGNLGEEPLRIVTLAKNAFWEKRTNYHDGAGPPVGDVKLAAVRAIPPPMATAAPGGAKLETLKTKKSEIAFYRGPNDVFRLYPLHSNREVLVWMSGPVDSATFERGAKAILEVLDGQTGDNDNPRCAGRDAYEAMKIPRDKLNMAVIQLLHQHGRVKYFTGGWKRSLSLGVRGIKPDYGQQQFDEGGECTVPPGDRLFFPGTLPYEGEFHHAEPLAQVWPGGKASRLYEALLEHWKTKNSAKALEKLALAAASDVKIENVFGMALVTGLA